MRLDDIVQMAGSQTLLDQFRKKRKGIEQLVDTIHKQHHEAYTSASNEYLLNDKGEVDYEKLENEGTASSVADHIADFYLEAAKKKFNINKDLSPEEEDMLLNMYVNTTRDELRRQFKTNGKKLTLNTYSTEIVPELQKALIKKIAPSAYSHIEETEEHIGELVRDMGLSDKVDYKKARLSDLVEWLDHYHASDGDVPKDVLKKSPAYMKKAA